MKFKDPKGWGLMIGAGLAASFVSIPQARSELVYDNGAQANPQVEASAPAQVRGDDRESLRQVLTTSQKAQVTVQATEPAAVVAAPIVVQGAAPQVATAPETQILSKTELMRRERVREEVKNEDILQERLEELRLRDERNRSAQLLGTLPAPTASAQAPVSAPAPLVEEVVVAPITERPGQPAPAVVAPAPVAASGVSAAPVAAVSTLSDTMTTSASSSTSVADEEKVAITVAPRGGLTNLNGNTYYSVQSRYSAGVGAGVAISENLSFEAGYAFTEFGVAQSSTNPSVVGYQYFNGINQPFTMKQNVVDAGLKLYFLSPSAKLRPYVGGGGAFSKSFVNYDQRIINALYQSGYQAMARDYEVNSFLGYVAAGMDIRLSKSISIGTSFKYYSVLTTRESSNWTNVAAGYQGLGAYSAYTPYYGNYYAADTDKQQLGSTLARAGFYSILAGINFSF